MLLKRSVFVILLIALFSGCFYIMNQHYDELARYPHELSEEERKLVLSPSQHRADQLSGITKDRTEAVSAIYRNQGL